MKILHFGLLCNVATLALSVATPVFSFSGTSRRWIYSFSTTSRRWNYPPSVTSRRWIPTSRRWLLYLRERRDVQASRRWIPTSRRWLLYLRERRDVQPERRDVAPVYCLKASHSCPTLTHPCWNPHMLLPKPTVATSDHLAASAPTSLPPLTPVPRPCLAHPSPRSGALAPASVGSL